MANSLTDGSHGPSSNSRLGLPRGTRSPRRGLAMRTEITASSGDDGAPDLCSATKTRLALAAIRAMSLLVFSGLTFRIHKIQYRRTAILDGMLQYSPNGLAKPAE